MQMSMFMRNAYDARSVIVHGGTQSEKALRDLNGQPASIDHFTAELETTLRRGLKTAMYQVARDKTFPPNWEELIFAGPRER